MKEFKREKRNNNTQLFINKAKNNLNVLSFLVLSIPFHVSSLLFFSSLNSPHSCYLGTKKKDVMKRILTACFLLSVFDV